MDPAALSIQCLVKIHPGPVYALRGIDLEIPEGMFGLLGPNGAGKSTFMNIGAAIVEPTASRYLLVWSHQPRPLRGSASRLVCCRVPSIRLRLPGRPS